MLLSSMQFNKSWYNNYVYWLDIIADWSEIVVYHNLAAFCRLETWKHPPLLALTYPYLEDVPMPGMPDLSQV